VSLLAARPCETTAAAEDRTRVDRARRFLEAVGVWIAAASALGRVEALERAERLLLAERSAPTEDRGLRALEVVTLCRGAAAWLGRGDRARAGLWLERARERGGSAPAPLADAWLHALSASAALHAGDLATFLADTEHAVEAYERAGDARNACNQRVRLANALVSVGALARAEPLLVRAREDAERMQLSLVAAYAVQNLGHVLGRLGREAEAREALEDAEGRGAALGDRQLVTGARLYLALLALEDRHEEARARALEPARRALEGAQDEGPFRAIAEAVYARAALAAGDLAGASASVAAAVRWLDAHGPIEEGEAAVRRAHVEVLVARGQDAEAREVARRAVEALEARAASLPAALRAGFLEGHPDHRRLRALV
jgi:ATP/maltotriose-dependent transcriptional regulator MalT